MVASLQGKVMGPPKHLSLMETSLSHQNETMARNAQEGEGERYTVIYLLDLSCTWNFWWLAPGAWGEI